MFRGIVSESDRMYVAAVLFTFDEYVFHLLTLLASNIGDALMDSH